MIQITVEQANEILHSMRWKLVKSDYAPSELEQNTIKYLQDEVNKILSKVHVSSSNAELVCKCKEQYESDPKRYVYCPIHG